MAQVEKSTRKTKRRKKTFGVRNSQRKKTKSRNSLKIWSDENDRSFF